MRGTGSLHALLGKSGYSTVKKRKADQQQAELGAGRGTAVPTPSSALPQPVSPLTGCVRCPVCEKQLPYSADVQSVNDHIDRCLLKTNAKRTKQQATLLLYAERSLDQRELAGSSDSGVSRSSTGSEEDWGPAVDGHSPRGTPADSRRSTDAALAAGSVNAGAMTCFPCCVVGRRFQRASRCHPGQRLSVEPELNNPRDAQALLVTDAEDRSVVLGHLPHVVARHLGPLLREGRAAAEAVVLEDPPPAGDNSAPQASAPLPIELQVTVLASAAAVGRPPSSQRIATAVTLARQAAEQHARQPVGTGERLRANFGMLLATVQQRDGSLLDSSERQLITSFEALDAAAQCLFLRLSQRSGPLFRLDTLSYQDVPNAARAARALQAAGIAQCRWPGQEACTSAAGSSTQCDVRWDQLACLLTVPELLAALNQLVVSAAAAQNGAGSSKGPPNRASALAALRRHGESASPAARAATSHVLLACTGPVLQLCSGTLTALKRLQRLFFLNEGHTLGQLMAVDVGGVRYPSYTIACTRTVFPSRSHLLAYEQALAQAEQLTDALELADWAVVETAMAPAWAALDAGQHKQALDEGEPQLFLRRFDAAWVHCMMATAGVSALERHGRYQEAVGRLQQLLGGWCCPSRRGHWWVRLSTDLEHLGRPSDALEMAEAALADEWLSPGDRLALQRRVLRLGKPPRRWKRPLWADAALWEPPEVRIEGRPLGRVLGVKSRFYGPDDEQCTVEQLALQHYASQEGGGWQGMHSEGGIWATLFGLLVWDVLFSPVEDVFRSPLQTAPLDLDTDAFYPARRDGIEVTLADIAGGGAPAALAASWESHRGCMCRGVSWDRWELAELQLIAECVGGPGLAAVCRLLAQDHGGWGGGMPDLLLWHPERRVAKLSEVKGPRDRLSDQQRAWIAALSEAGVAVEVLKVVEPGVGKGKGKGRGQRK